MIGRQLQVAIVAALKAGNVAGSRIYDAVPDRAVFPYVTLGDEQVTDAGNTCSDSWEVFADIHVWSRSTSARPEVKDIGAQIVPLLARSITVAGFQAIIGELQTSRVLRDPDGETAHGVLTFRFVLDPL